MGHSRTEFPLTPQGEQPEAVFVVLTSDGRHVQHGGPWTEAPGVELFVECPKGEESWRYPTREDWAKVRPQVVALLDETFNGPLSQWQQGGTSGLGGVPGAHPPEAAGGACG